MEEAEAREKPVQDVLVHLIKRDPTCTNKKNPRGQYICKAPGCGWKEETTARGGRWHAEAKHKDRKVHVITTRDPETSTIPLRGEEKEKKRRQQRSRHNETYYRKRQKEVKQPTSGEENREH